MTSQYPSLFNLAPITVATIPTGGLHPSQITTPKLRVDVLGGRPVVRLRWPDSNEYYPSWVIDYTVVQRMYQYVRAKVAAGNFDRPSTYKSGCLFRRGSGRMGSWRLKVARKELHIGCQTISYRELGMFAAAQGWPPLPKTKRKAKAS